MKFYRYLAVVAMLLLATVGAFAQSAVTGALTGGVTSDGAPLPGVLVTATSPQLQGTRTAVSDANGNYNLAALPPGDYTLRFSLEGLQEATRSARVTVAGTARVDVDLKVSSVTESITVTASAPAVLETTEVQANFQKRQVDDLPLGRNPVAIANLAPGVTNNGPGNNLQISGAMSSDNLIMVNGAVVQDNVRGSSRPLYIEDAIQETTVLSAGVSAEYGNFTGGVVSSITKSGGNEFTGSLRDSLTNPSWTEVSAAGEPKGVDQTNPVYEATLGGRIIRDRLWFFLAGRNADSTAPSRNPDLVGQTGTVINSETENTRWEAKLTGQITPSHSLMLNYLDNPLSFTNDTQFRAWDLGAVDPFAEQDESFRALHYNGIFTSNLLGEVSYNKRQFTFIGFGGDNTDLVLGTPLLIWRPANAAIHSTFANAPAFCGVCSDEFRDSEKTTAKLTYFLGTQRLGTHNLVAGAERYVELLQSNNWQSASGLTLYNYSTDPVVVNNTPIFTLDPGDELVNWRVDNPSLGSDLTTDSFFINDKWDLNPNFSFNIGGRFDTTEAVDQAANPTADESSFSPRLGATYDPTGNGRLRFGATFGRYVGRLAEGVQGASANAGSPNIYSWYYDGETVTGNSRQIIQTVIDWFNARGGFNATLNPPEFVSIGGFSTRLQEGGVKAPSMDEWTIGAGFQYSPTGYVRADYINREWNNFYTSITNAETGRVTLPSTGATADLTIVGNSDVFERTYRGVQLQANQRFFNRLQVGGSYTWSELRGNVEGETSGSGPVSTGGFVNQYPEYQGFEQNAPIGFLSGDQTHKLRAWAGVDVPLGPAGILNISALHRFDSGRPFSSAMLITPCGQAATAALPTNCAKSTAGATNYVSPPTNNAGVIYFVGERGRFRWDDINRTDLAVNYRLPVFGAEMFVEAEVLNAFNNQAQIAGQTGVISGRNGNLACVSPEGAAVRCQSFNPFSGTEPIEGTHYAFTPTFGQPVAGSSASYQLARTFQFSFGFRF
ncbi:MAG TPA: TonB-dependent receptor [Thermoanaerobaculia bacterium]|nr:TonB-dependent receptor [Thermoanaerobaculia bacterium]